jgi:hypothetical protein
MLKTLLTTVSNSALERASWIWAMVGSAQVAQLGPSWLEIATVHPFHLDLRGPGSIDDKLLVPVARDTARPGMANIDSDHPRHRNLIRRDRPGYVRLNNFDFASALSCKRADLTGLTVKLCCAF